MSVRRLSLNQKINICFIAILSGVLITLFFAVRTLMSDSVVSMMARDLQGNVKSLERLQQVKAAAAIQQGLVVADSPKLKAALSTRDPATARHTLETYVVGLGASFLVATDAHGAVFASAGVPPATMPPSMPGVDEAMKGVSSLHFWESGDVYRVVANPVLLGDQLLGVLLVGTRVDRAWCDEMAELTRAQVSLVSGRDVIVSTLDPAQIATLRTTPTARRADGLMEVELDGQPFLVDEMAAAKGSMLRILFMRSLGPYAAALRRMQWIFAGVGAVTTLLALLAGFVLSRNITAPLGRLIQAITLRPDGDVRVPRVRLEATDRDVAQLETSFNTLSEALETSRLTTEMKSMFLANMSHEIRTPMNAVIGLSDLALKTPLSVRQRDYVEKIHRAGNALLGIIDNILDFSKIEAGRLDLDASDFKVDDVIAFATSLIGQRAHEKGLELLVSVADAVPQHLVGDALRLGQVLTNLLNNAVKFTDHGEVCMAVDVAGRDDGHVTLRFSVRDTGPGMTAEQAGRLFQPFTQADMSVTRKHGGTGLGLSISRHLVELMGGRIWLESKPGEGSTFYFTAVLKLGSGPARIVPERLRALHVLVVDDNPSARDCLREALQTVGGRVHAVSSGPEALDSVSQASDEFPYDVVFMDWKMAEMDGLQAVEAMRRDPRIRRQPRIVMVTAHGREEVRDEAERINVDAFLVKPVTRSMLVDTLVGIFAPTFASPSGPVDTFDGVLQGARILLVEDKSINQQVATELLQAVGARVDVASNGQEAVDMLVEGAVYDIVLMDLQMPVMDGYQATTIIRADARFKDLPILAMTAHATVAERERCLAAGMNAHIAKPVNPSVLYQTLSRFYPSPRSAPDVPAPPDGAADMPVVEGLNTREGLDRVAGKRDLYLALLRQFVTDQRTCVSAIRASLAAERREEAGRAVHSLRGVAGTIGATAVSEAAIRLETALSDGHLARVESEIASLESLVDSFIAALELQLPSRDATPAENAPVADSDRTREVADEMRRQLATFDMAACETLETHRSELRALMSAQDFARFEALVQSYSFGEALAVLPPATV